MTTEEAPLSSVLDDLERSGGDEAASIGQVLDAFQHRSVGVLLTLFGLIASLPIIGGIPGVSILTGTLILTWSRSLSSAAAPSGCRTSCAGAR